MSYHRCSCSWLRQRYYKQYNFRHGLCTIHHIFLNASRLKSGAHLLDSANQTWNQLVIPDTEIPQQSDGPQAVDHYYQNWSHNPPQHHVQCVVAQGRDSTCHALSTGFILWLSQHLLNVVLVCIRFCGLRHLFYVCLRLEFQDSR